MRDNSLYLQASLLADDRPEVRALAVPVGSRLDLLRAERDTFERAEDAVTVLSARTNRRDKILDRLVIAFGGVVRAIDGDLYNRFFAKLNPTAVTRAALDREVIEVERILGELARLPDGDEMRGTYEPRMRAALDNLREAMRQSEQVDIALSLARSKLDQFKLAVDQLRYETHGKLQSLLKSRALADEYFRPTTTAAAADEDEKEPAPPAPAPVTP